MLDRLESGTVSRRDLDSIKAKIVAGDCPFCTKTGFRVVASHISNVHSIRSRDLRDLVGFNYSESITDPDYHVMMSEINRPKLTEAAIAAARASIKPNPKWRKRPEVHGTFRQWVAGCRCDECLENYRRYHREWARRTRVPKPMVHGTLSGFMKGCRCDDCYSAKRYVSRKNGERIRARTPQANHGTHSRYVSGCRCDVCVGFRRKYQNERQATYRARRRKLRASVNGTAE